MDHCTSLSPKVKCKSTNGDGYGDIALERPKILGWGRLGRIGTLRGIPLGNKNVFGYPEAFTMINNKCWIRCTEKNVLVKLKPDPTLDACFFADLINQPKETEMP